MGDTIQSLLMRLSDSQISLRKRGNVDCMGCLVKAR